jgi:hypothetical protein
MKNIAKFAFILTLIIASTPLALMARPAKNNLSLRNTNSEFSFALIGDLPYGDEQVAKFENVIKEINDDHRLQFVMHTGDIKGGSELCSDELIKRRFEQFKKFQDAFILTPGDNDWTDCHRVNNGKYNPIERLGFLRRLFYPKPEKSLGQRPIKVIPQSSISSFDKYVENVIFERNNVVFSTIHVVGSNNNLAPWTGIDPNDSISTPREDRINEFKERLQATLNWLEYTFQYAKDNNTKAVFIMIQANPQFELAENDPNRAGFNDFIAKLRQLTQEYGKPVILAQGDNHEYFINKPFDTDGKTPSLINFTRIQAFGSPRVHWIKVNVDPKSSHVFSFEEKIVPENVDVGT